MYTDPFIGDAIILDGIRMASVDDIVTMKMNVVSRGRRNFTDFSIADDMPDPVCLLNKN